MSVNKNSRFNHNYHLSEEMHASLCYLKIFLFLFVVSGFAQAEIAAESLKGTILNPQGEPLAYATISITDSESDQFLSGTITDESGQFTIQYPETSSGIRISVSMVGYRTWRSEIIRRDSDPDLGVITLEEAVAELGEISVQASRPRLVIEADRTIVNVEGTVLAEGSDVLDVVGRSPGVYVDGEGNITLNGRSGVIVLIDGRQTHMSSEELANYLRTMPADNIERIEIMENPPARYDAEGSGGVIDIRLKQNRLDGMHGQISMGHRYNVLHAPSGNAAVNFKRGPWSSRLSLDRTSWAGMNTLDLNRRIRLGEEISFQEQQARIRMNNRSLGMAGSLYYQLHDQHTIGMNLRTSGSNGSDDGRSLSTLFSHPLQGDLRHLSADTDNLTKNRHTFGNLNYTGTLDSLGSTLTADIDYREMGRDSDGLLTSFRWIDPDENGRARERILDESEMRYSVFTANAEYLHQFSNGSRLESGLKWSHVDSDNDLLSWFSEADEPYQPGASSNHFIYSERIQSAFTSLTLSPLERLQATAGLRAEWTHLRSHSVTLDEIHRQRYLDLFPSLYLTYRFSDRYQMATNASRRINRPSYHLLNPFVFYIDPLTVSRGNPYLKPQYTLNTEWAHILDDRYRLTLSYSRTSNDFRQVISVDDETQIMAVQNQNLDRSEQYSLQLLLPIDITRWYSATFNGQLRRDEFRSQLNDAHLNQGMTALYLQSRHEITLPEAFRLEMSASYASPHRSGMFQISGSAWVDAGISKSFLNGAVQTSLNVNDLFASLRHNIKIDFDRIDSDLFQYHYTRSIRFNIRWNFNRGDEFRVQERSGSSEERGRLE